MEPIDIVGIGNALVDQEFEVTDEFLQQHQIEKGMMTLIEDADQERLIELLAKRGELKKQSGGGSAANSLVMRSREASLTASSKLISTIPSVTRIQWRLISPCNWGRSGVWDSNRTIDSKSVFKSLIVFKEKGFTKYLLTML